MNSLTLVLFMAEPTLTQIFGTNAIQDASTVTISKSDLTSVGFTASADDSAEKILVAILLKAQAYLTEANQDLNIDQSITITGPSSNIITRNNTSYREYSFTLAASKVDTETSVNPNDF